jgi:glycerate 2-kinase
VLCLISGGGSSLLSLPAPGIELGDKQAINRALLHSGASIHEMNCVRKHLSAIKAGRLAVAAAPAKLVSLIISDVPGDEPSVIASGPTVPDATTLPDASAVLKRYSIEAPPSVRGVSPIPTQKRPNQAIQFLNARRRASWQPRWLRWRRPRGSLEMRGLHL